MSENRTALQAILAAMLLWVVMDVTAGMFAGHYSSFEVVWLRYGVHLVLMFLVWGWRGPSLLWRTERPLFQLGRSMLMVGMPTSWILGMRWGVAEPEMLSVFWLSPLILLVIAGSFLQERVSTLVWVFTAIACVGALMLLRPNFQLPLHLLLLPLVMAVCFAAYVAMTRSLRSEDRRVNLFYTAFGVFIAFTPLMARVWTTPLPRDVPLFIGIGVFGFLSLYAIDVGAAAAPVSIGAPATYVQPLLVAAAAGVVAGQRLTELGWAGVLLISTSVAFIWVRAPHLRVFEAK
jgi:drug/metabolite transporter (DMT)-like permease